MSKVRPRMGSWWLVTMLSGCAGAQPSGSAPSYVEVRPTSGAAPARPNANHGVGAGESAAEDGEDQAPSPAVVLPTSTDFTELPIPPPDTARYSTWKQLGHTRIGKGDLHLQPLDERRLLVKSAAEPTVRVIDVATRREVLRWDIVNLEPEEEHIVLPWPNGGEP